LVEGGQATGNAFPSMHACGGGKEQVLVGVESLLLSKPVGHLPILSDITVVEYLDAILLPGR
jgi:hypothetical protein